MKSLTKILTILVTLAAMPSAAKAQQTLTLEDCRKMAIENNQDVQQARTKVEMAGYDRQIAFSNYLPNISATGAYMYNSENINLISEDMGTMLSNLGTGVQGNLTQTMTQLMTAIQSNPQAALEYVNSPMWQTVLGALSQTDVSTALNSLGAEMQKSFEVDIENVFIAGVSLQQPVFMGGKIIAANKIARLAEELAKAQYDTKYQQTIIDVDQAYWQAVSVAAKKRLAESYADLLHKMEKDVEITIAEGVATESDALNIKVKANEADMLLTKATGGLKLSKMLLCKLVGLDLNSDIVLADEALDAIPVPQLGAEKPIEDIWADRSETRSLDLASQIYDGKVAVARADMMPKVALMANYLMSNPNPYNGFQKEWGGMFNAGVVVNIPIFHGFNALNKTRKAKAEATLYRSQYENAKNLINLQVSQLREQQGEAVEKLVMAENNLKHAEENLRVATLGFENGVVSTTVAMGAQTAWLKAHSEYIDAGIELQMTNSNLNKAEGNLKSDIDEK
ncbi:MAG: TolC family protein [Bacteroidales bacterium]|nr:TolC family protein [Bacteroidales bacterium]